ncbi:hypothetical protein BH11MYX1_BH11MYX1_56430 [soil metagenome]
MRLILCAALAGCGCAPSAATSDGAPVHDTAPLDGSGSGSDASAGSDYDGDGIPDDLDFCPHIANAANPDADHAGVGADCDPRPGLLDKRVYWSSFDNPLEINSWLGVGAWSVQSGEAVQGSTNNSPSYLQFPILVNRAYVATRLVAGTLSGNGSAVGIRILATSSNLYGCAFARAMGNISTTATTNSTQTTTGPWPTNQIAGHAYTVAENLSTATNQNGCAFVDASSATTVSLMSGYASGETAPAGHVELATLDATAAYEYLFIVETAP